MKKILLFLLFALLPMVASADPVEIDGIYYNLITENKTAEVTSNPNKYSGEGAIPSSVTYNDVEYSVTSIGELAFAECDELDVVTIPNSVTSIGPGAFAECIGLTSITIPNSVTSIGESAFENCTSLTSITIPNSVTSIGVWAFEGTAWYNNQPDGLVYAGKVAYTYKGDMPENTKIILNDGTLGIGDYAFSGCSGLTSITIPNSVTSIGGFAFRSCSSLTSITIPNSVTSIGESAFSRCTSLTSITIPNNVTSIGSEAFFMCTSLTSITIPNSVTSIGISAFRNCSSLTSITIPNSVTSIGICAFDDCSSLTSITIPNSVTSIGGSAFAGTAWYNNQPDGLVYAGKVAYKYKGDMPENTKIILNDGTLGIGGGAFSGCSGLTSITIPNSVTSIGGSAFQNCSSLTSVNIPNGVTSIGDYAFYKCTSLTSITIGSGVKNIYRYAFGNCPELTDFYCYAVNVPQTVTSSFDGSKVENATLHVPGESLQAYKETEPWSNFGTIVGLSDDTGLKCVTPTICYDNDNKKLTFGCETEGVEYVYCITDTDVKQGYDAEVTLTATYEISVYATKAGYDNSNVATATLVWSNASFTETTPATAIEYVQESAALPVLIQNNGGTLTIQGAADGTPISVYTVAGIQAGSAVSQNSRATISTSMQQGDIAIVKIGNRSVKVVIK